MSDPKLGAMGDFEPKEFSRNFSVKGEEFWRPQTGKGAGASTQFSFFLVVRPVDRGGNSLQRSSSQQWSKGSETFL